MVVGERKKGFLFEVDREFGTGVQDLLRAPTTPAVGKGGEGRGWTGKEGALEKLGIFPVDRQGTKN